MLHADTNLFNPLVPKAHNIECQNLLFSLQIKPLKVNSDWQIFVFCTTGTNGLRVRSLAQKPASFLQ